ncbi:T9SS type A sorting domain-containing protein [candidate division KSB1 bacterium]|nr:T9SS type A sorting domain-containing protein [candidate division KSB1 bacterium]
MKRSFHHFRILCVMLVPAIAHSQIDAPNLKRFGLEGESIRAIDLARAGSDYDLYAAADETGILRRNLSSPDSVWVNLGLPEKMFAALDIQVWGAGPAVFQTPVVAVFPNYAQGDSTLIYRLDSMHWIPSDSGIPRNRYISIYAMASSASSRHESAGFAYAGGDNEFLFRACTPSRQWQQLQGYLAIDGPSILVIAINQNAETHEVWTGGFTGLNFQPWLKKSTDFGMTWESFSFELDLGPENAPHSVAFHQTNPNHVYLAMMGAIIKTMDGGHSWHFTGLHDKSLVWRFHSVVIDPFDFDHIYAGGGNASAASNGILWESFDAGKTWQEIPYHGSWVTGIIPDPFAANAIYFATLGDGVWKYTVPAVAIQTNNPASTLSPPTFELRQNYPNPFAPASAEPFLNTTAIHYRLSRETQVTLTIYDVLGVNWNGRDQHGEHVPSGVYFCRLTAGSFAQTRKLAVVQ